MLADVAEVEVELTGAGRCLGGGRGQTQGRGTGVGRDMPDLLEGGSRQLKDARTVPCLHDQTLRLGLQRNWVASCNN